MAYGEHAVSRTQVFRWHKVFLDGRENAEGEARSGRPCTSKTDENVTKARDLVRSYRSLTVRMISSVLNLNSQIVHCHTAISVNEYLAKKDISVVPQPP